MAKCAYKMLDIPIISTNEVLSGLKVLIAVLASRFLLSWLLTPKFNRSWSQLAFDTLNLLPISTSGRSDLTEDQLSIVKRRVVTDWRYWIIASTALLALLVGLTMLFSVQIPNNPKSSIGVAVTLCLLLLLACHYATLRIVRREVSAEN